MDVYRRQTRKSVPMCVQAQSEALFRWMTVVAVPPGQEDAMMFQTSICSPISTLRRPTVGNNLKSPREAEASVPTLQSRKSPS
jgi:hypothetical protein